MAYCVLADMEKLIPSNLLITLSSDVTNPTEVDQDNIDEAIEQADREIDAYLSVIIAVPLTTVPPLVTNLSANMAIWHLHVRKYFDSKVWYRTYERCLEILEKIAQGKIGLLPESLDDAEAMAQGGYAVSTPTQVMTGTLAEDNFWDKY